jgi:signal transduction histidine kinase
MEGTSDRVRVAWIIPAAVLVAAAGLLILFRLNRIEERAAQRVMLERGDTVLNSLTAGIRAQSRRGRYRSEQLDAIFSELSGAPGIVGLELRSEHGDVIAQGGSAVLFPVLVPGYPIWEESFLVMACEASFTYEPPGGSHGRDRGGPWGKGGPPRHERGRPGEEPSPGWGGPHGERPPNSEEGSPPDGERDPNRERGPGQGRGPGRGHPPEGFGPMDLEGFEGGKPWESGTYVLTVVLDTRPMGEEIARARLRLAMGAGIGLLALVSGVAALLARNRQRKMQTELLLATEQVAQSEKLARMGAGLAHETKNPLGVVRGLAQGIGSDTAASAETKRVARDIVDEADRTVGQINSFLAMARPENPELRPIELNDFFERFGPLLEAETAGEEVAIVCEGNGLCILADEDLLRRALLNLTINASRACHGNGRIRIEARQEDGKAAITVADTGCGIAPEDLPHVTEPYFTRFEGGCGLGLSIVEQTVRVHGWTLDIHSTPREGTRVTLGNQVAVV